MWQRHGIYSPLRHPFPDDGNTSSIFLGPVNRFCIPQIAGAQLIAESTALLAAAWALASPLPPAFPAARGTDARALTGGGS